MLVADGIDCEQSLIFLLRHASRALVKGERGGREERAGRKTERRKNKLLLFPINWRSFTFSLAAPGSEERRTTARGLLM